MRSSDIRKPNTSWPTVILIIIGVIFTALDQTVVVTVLPEMMLDMEISITELDQASWIITGYLLGYTVAIPLMARMADAHGHVFMLRVCLMLFAVGSILVALSTNLQWLVASRVLQALGGGSIIPIGMVLVARALPAQHKLIAVGMVGAAAEIGVVLGPLYGGSITRLLDWRWLFWLDVPQAAIILIGLIYLRNQPIPGSKVDYFSGFLLALSLSLLVIAFSQRILFSLASPISYALAVAGLAMLALLIWRQNTITQPLISPAFFRSRAALASIAVKLLVGAALIIAMVTIPLMADTVHRQSPYEGGLRLMRLTAAIPIGAIAGGYLAHILNRRKVAILGLLITAVGFFLMSTWDLGISDPQLSIDLAISGLGFGLVIAPLFVTAMDSGPKNYQATSASMVTVSRMVGMSLGLAALSAWGVDHFQALTSSLQFPVPNSAQFVPQGEQLTLVYAQQLADAGMSLFQGFFRIAGILVIVGIVPALGLGTKQQHVSVKAGDDNSI